MTASSSGKGEAPRAARMAAVQRLVVKVGTTTLAGDGNKLARPVIRRLVDK